eukprot:363192-Chlamydomonas_euryale.AAC.1
MSAIAMHHGASNMMCRRMKEAATAVGALCMVLAHITPGLKCLPGPHATRAPQELSHQVCMHGVCSSRTADRSIQGRGCQHAHDQVSSTMCTAQHSSVDMCNTAQHSSVDMCSTAQHSSVHMCSTAQQSAHVQHCTAQHSTRSLNQLLGKSCTKGDWGARGGLRQGCGRFRKRRLEPREAFRIVLARPEQAQGQGCTVDRGRPRACLWRRLVAVAVPNI